MTERNDRGKMLGMDWKQLIDDLRSRMGSQVAIHHATGIAESRISELASGVVKDPRYSIGSRLVELHRKKMRQRAKKAR